MKLAIVLILLTMLAALPAMGNPEKIPSVFGGEGDRVECDLSEMLYFHMNTGDDFDNTDGPNTYGPLATSSGGFIDKVVLQVDIDQTWIGDLVIDLYYDVNGDGIYDAGPVSALCRPSLDGCAYDGCCGCSGDITGIYTFGDDGGAPMGEDDCPAAIPNGCYQSAIESPQTFAQAFDGLIGGGDFYLEVADGAGGDVTYFNSWGVHVYNPYNEILVKADGTGDVPTIQDAILAIVPGGTIYLADGVYSGIGNWDLEFFGKPLELRSQSLNPEACILDGLGVPIGSLPAGSGRASIPLGRGVDRDYDDWGMFFWGGETASTSVRGITFRHFVTTFYGACIYISNSSPTIEDCIFENNYSDIGGAGIWIEGASSPTITGCTFRYNQGTNGAAVLVWLPGASPDFDGCTFHDNYAIWGGAFADFDGGSARVDNSVFYNNGAEFGGAVLSAANGLGGSDFRYTTFSENSATEGGTVWSDGDIQFWFDIIAFSNDGGAFHYEGGGLPDIACTNIFGNVEGDWTGPLAGLLASDGNMNSDPQFCGNLGSWDFRLQSDSPCAHENNSCSSNMGAFGSECGTSASEISNWSRIKRLY